MMMVAEVEPGDLGVEEAVDAPAKVGDDFHRLGLLAQRPLPWLLVVVAPSGQAPRISSTGWHESRKSH